MRNKMGRMQRQVTAILMACMLNACGGGGGGGGSSGEGTAPPVATREVPLALTSANAENVSAVTLAFGELGLIFAQMAHDWSAAFSSVTGNAIDLRCDQGGTLSLRLTDRDNNQRASAGDQVTVTLSNCYLRTFDDPLDGTLTIDLVAPTTSGTQEAGTVTIGNRLALPGSPELRFEGVLRYEYGADALNSVLRVFSGSVPLALTSSTGTTSTRDVVTALDARKEVHRDTARTASRMQYRLASDLLGGSLQISTEVPLDGYFNTAPDTGRVVATGAGGAAVAVSTTVGSLVRSFGGTSLALPLADAATGYLWWAAGATAPGPGTRGYDTQTVVSNAAVLLSPPAAELRQNPAPLVWQYSRAVTSDQATPVATLAIVQAGSGLAWAASSVPTTVRFDGAQLTITPRGLLKPGARYELRYFGGLSGPSQAPVSTPTFTATVPDTIRARASAAVPAGLLGHAAALALDGTGSSAPGSALAGATWRQVSGPAVVFTNANTLTPTVSIAPASTASGTAEFELEVRNTAGDIDRARTSVAVINDLSDTRAIRVLPSDTGVAVWSLGTGVPGTVGSDGYARVFNNGAGLDVSTSDIRLLMSQSALFAAGQSGTYAAGSGVNVVFFARSSDCSTATNGSYGISELTYGADNVITRLTMEITVNCPGSASIRAALRVNSTAPVSF